MTQINAQAAARHAQPDAPSPRIAKAAEDFAAVAIAALLKPMFEAVDDDSNPFGGGPGEKAWKPMMIDEIARNIAQKGGLGLTAPIAQAMLQAQEKAR